MQRTSRRLVLLLVGALSGGCTGNIGADQGPGGGATGDEPGSEPGSVTGPGSTGTGSATGPKPAQPSAPGAAKCTGSSPGQAPLRRLTHREYDNTVRALLGDTSGPGSGFAPEEVVFGFDNNAEARGTTPLLAEQYLGAAEALAGKAVQDLPRLLGCNPDGAARDTCVQQWLDAFGKRAFRRPLDAAERTRLLGVYSTGRDKWGLATGVQLTLEAILLSPHFLYRVEFGAPATGGATVVALGAYEMASRLSYFLWAGPPDDQLYAAAAAGQLATRDQVLVQARRMLQDPKARAMTADFHRQWLQLDRIDTAEKDPKVFKTFTNDVRTLLHRETDAFIANVLWTGKGDLTTLLTAPYSLMNAKVAAYYGVKGPSTDSFEMTMLDGSQRAGLLTQGAILAANSHSNESSPVHRGKFVRTQLLCTMPPPPPPDVMIKAPTPNPQLTTRELFAAHSTDPFCAGCHSLMDPIGLGFENYDGVGLWRTTENGKPIDATGDLLATDVDGKFVGVPALGARLAGSARVGGCVVTEWFRYAFGRDEADGDACTHQQLQARFAMSGGDLRDLVLGLTQSDPFLFRNAIVAGGAP